MDSIAKPMETTNMPAVRKPCKMGWHCSMVRPSSRSSSAPRSGIAPSSLPRAGEVKPEASGKYWNIRPAAQANLSRFPLEAQNEGSIPFTRFDGFNKGSTANSARDLAIKLSRPLGSPTRHGPNTNGCNEPILMLPSFPESLWRLCITQAQTGTVKPANKARRTFANMRAWQDSLPSRLLPTFDGESEVSGRESDSTEESNLAP